MAAIVAVASRTIIKPIRTQSALFRGHLKVPRHTTITLRLIAGSARPVMLGETRVTVLENAVVVESRLARGTLHVNVFVGSSISEDFGPVGVHWTTFTRLACCEHLHTVGAVLLLLIVRMARI